MTYSFNLIHEPWIPCLCLDGRPVDLGLRDTLFQAHELREIRGDTPLETAALHRLLLVILHRVFGPSGPTEWKRLWKQGKGQIDTTRLTDYLLDPDIAECFDLFDPVRPFYQPRKMFAGDGDTTIDPQGPKPKGKLSQQAMLEKMAKGGFADDKKTPVTSLLIHAASGNNATLFDHNTEAVGLCLTPAQAARALIVSQLFGLGGTSSTSQNFEDAPGAKGVLFLAYGDNLFQTLILNLVRYDEDMPLPTPDDDDRPAWEMEDPFLPDRSQPKGYLDYLTWHNRRVWLYPEETNGRVVVRRMVWSPGLMLKGEDIDPMKHFSADRQGNSQPMCFTAERALWRDSSVLFELSGSTKPPQVVQWLASLSQPPHSVLDATHLYQLMALGLSKSKASLEFLRAEALPLPTSLLIKRERVADLGHAMQTAVHAASALRAAVFVLAWLLLYPTTDNAAFDALEKIELKIGKGRNPRSDDKDAQRAFKLYSSWGIERYYWAGLEPYFHRMVQDLPDEPEKAGLTWRREVRRAATTAFRQSGSYAAGDRRAQRAAALAHQWFNIGLAAAVGKAGTLQYEGGEEE